MSQPDYMHLQKTLCAMRWIALLSGQATAAKAFEHDQENIKGAKP